MKKNAFYLFAVALALTIFVSCNSASEEVTNDLDDALESMDSALNELENIDVDAVDTIVVEEVVE
jgi:hypothetical protein